MDSQLLKQVILHNKRAKYAEMLGSWQPPLAIPIALSSLVCTVHSVPGQQNTHRAVFYKILSSDPTIYIYGILTESIRF